MNVRERIEAFWAGEKPDRIPYTVLSFIFWNGLSKDPAWGPLFENGLGMTMYISSHKTKGHDYEVKKDTYIENGKTIKRTTWVTPVGEAYQEEVMEDNSVLGWVRKYVLCEPEDYRVMTWVTNHTDVLPAYDKYEQTLAKMPSYGIPDMIMGRGPMQKILVDYAGVENFAEQLFECEEEVEELYEAYEKFFAKQIDVIAGGPGRYVNIRENFTSEALGAKRYEKYFMPVYEKYIPILHQSGKIVGTHYDGRLRSCADMIAKAPMDLIESLTPPSEGDMELWECREKWPDKLFWSNIRVSEYELPEEELRARVRELVKQASPDGTKLAFEISEDIPRNWQKSLPIVLDELNHLEI